MPTIYRETDAIAIIGALIAKNKDLPGVEFEFRLGRVSSSGKFDSNVGRINHSDITTHLGTNPHWEAIDKTHTTTYISSNMDIRYVINEDDEDDVYFQEKKRLHSVTFTVDGFPLDFRFSVSQETMRPDITEPQDEYQVTREKRRVSMRHKGFSFDVTEVSNDHPDDPDDEDSTHYEIEIEMTRSSDDISDISYARWYAHSGILKTMDLLKMCRAP